jgi:hypothetical protein
MIRVTSTINDPLFRFSANVRGLPVYLDNWALINLAKGDPSLRMRFVDAICTGGDLLFSAANVAELIGPQGKSSDAVKSLLNEFWPHWFPVELNPIEVVQREQNDAHPAVCCLSKGLLEAYVENRVTGYGPGFGQDIDLFKDFFRLGEVLDWVAQSERLRVASRALDEVVRNTICKYRTEYERNPSPLDQKCPQEFDPSRPATFAYWNLLRTLIVEAKSHQLKTGDGLDFCHAVMGSSFARVAALDKHWKRRVENLPKPNGLACIYYAEQLDAMVTDIESWVTHGAANSG